MTDGRLRLIAKTVDLNDPDKVSEYLANKEGKNGYLLGDKQLLPKIGIGIWL